MSREIKFRAFLDNEMCEVIGIFTNTKEAVCVVTNRILLDDEREQYHIEQTPIEIPFDNIKLMQYTGLKDKHGIEIYEGDILKYGLCVEVVFYEPTMGRFMTELKKCNDESEIGEISSLSPYYTDNYEVIGNIYQHKDLLK